MGSLHLHPAAGTSETEGGCVKNQIYEPVGPKSKAQLVVVQGRRNCCNKAPTRFVLSWVGWL